MKLEHFLHRQKLTFDVVVFIGGCKPADQESTLSWSYNI